MSNLNTQQGHQASGGQNERFGQKKETPEFEEAYECFMRLVVQIAGRNKEPWDVKGPWFSIQNGCPVMTGHIHWKLKETDDPLFPETSKESFTFIHGRNGKWRLVEGVWWARAEPK